MAPFPRIIDEGSLDGIGIDVAKGDCDLPEPVEDARMEPVAPEMTGEPALLVIGSGEAAQNPAHDVRKAHMTAGLHQEMEMRGFGLLCG